ncbi:hypothetical protein Tco_0405812 [Tanacetum coccineum]
MSLCTTLQTRVLDLETTKTTQGNEIASLKIRVKKLERRNRSRTHKLKRLYKVGVTARVESFREEESLGKDASKQGRIHDIDADEDIALVNDDNEMFDVDALAEEITLAQALAELKSIKPKANRVLIQEPEQGTTTTTPTTTIPVPKPPQDKGKGIMIKELVVEQVKPMKRLEQMRINEELAFKQQAKEKEEERLAREKAQQLAQRLQAQEQEELTDEEKARLLVQFLEQRRKYFSAKRAEEKRNKPPTKTQQKNTMITYLKNMEGWKHKDLKDKDFDSIKELFDKEIAEVDKDQEAAKIKELIEIVPDEEEVAIDAIPLAVKSPSIVDWKIHKEGKKTYYQIIRTDESSKMYLVFSHMLKSFNREDLETLWKLVKAKHRLTRPEEGYERVLWGDLKTMFDPHVEDIIWRNQQDYRVLWIEEHIDSSGFLLKDATYAQS